MAVEEILSFVPRKPHRYFDFVAYIQRRSVLQTGFIGGWGLTVSRKNLKVGKVQMNSVDNIVFFAK